MRSKQNIEFEGNPEGNPEGKRKAERFKIIHLHTVNCDISINGRC